MLQGEQNGNIPSLYSLIDSHADFPLTILKLLPFAGHPRAQGHTVDRAHFSAENFSIAKCEWIFVCVAVGFNGRRNAELTLANIDRNLSDTDCKVHVTKRQAKKADQLRLTFSFYSIDWWHFDCMLISVRFSVEIDWTKIRFGTIWTHSF